MGIRGVIFIWIFLLSSFAYSQEVVIRDNTTTGSKANVTKLGTLYGLNNDPIPAANIYNGQVSVTNAGTRVQFSAQAIRSVCIKALTGNTGKMYVGNSNVSSSNGYELPKDLSVCLDVNNLNLIYIDASVNGESVAYIAVN